jgi:HemY protein
LIWLLIRVALFIALVAALSFGVAHLLDTPGGVSFTWNGKQYPPVHPLMFVGLFGAAVLALWLLFKAIGLALAVIRFFAGDETAISRFFSRSRERRGLTALTTGMLALAEGDSRTALNKTRKAQQLLDSPELTNLLGAQAAQQAGDREKAAEFLKALARDDRTRAIGVKGLLKQAIEEGDTERAQKLAERAVELRPKDAEAIDALFNLQVAAGNWGAARRSLAAKIRTGTLPRPVGVRRDAVLALADARSAEESGDAQRARVSALEANRIAPSLAPAAAAAARQLIVSGEVRKAARVLRKAWKLSPHPDLAAAFAAIAPEEDAAARRKRFAALIGENPDHPESRMLDAELALTAEDFPAARRALGDLPETNPSTRTLALMAAIERGSGESEEVVRGWLAKALTAPRGERWVCSACGHVHGDWRPVCENCKAVDTLDWTAPNGDAQPAGGDAAMLPLIVGALAASDPEEDIDPPAEDVSADDVVEAQAEGGPEKAA